jgi:hypothetical protein
MRKMAGAIFFFCFNGAGGCRKLTKIVFILINMGFYGANMGFYGANVGFLKITWDYLN